jgi:hypothetical protein
MLGAVSASASAGDLTIQLTLPRLNVSEYHRPYVAVWLERPDQTIAANLTVWYETADGSGTKWLADLRQWWRRGGRELKFPVDGLTGATRPAGEHILRFAADRSPLAELPAGRYVAAIEAAREVGGREVVRIPFDWPARLDTRIPSSGATELGAVTVILTP